MKDVMDNVRNWMILHPHGTKEECIRDVIQTNECIRDVTQTNEDSSVCCKQDSQ